MRVQLAVDLAALVNHVFIKGQANMAAGARRTHIHITIANYSQFIQNQYQVCMAASLFSSVVMVLAFRPGVRCSNPVQTLHFGHAIIHLFLCYGLCS